MAVRTSQRVLLAKEESTYGTDPTPTGSADAILVRSLEISPFQSDVVERELIRGYMGNYETLHASQRVEINFDVEMVGSGSAGTAPAFGPLLKAISFNMIGIYNEPTDVANATPTYQNQAKPVLFKNGNTTSQQLFGYAGAVQSFSFDQSNQSVFRELVGGSKEVLITDRRPGGSIVLEAVTMATKNYFNSITEADTGNNTFQHGQEAGNIFTFSAPQTDLSGISYSDSDGIQMLNIDYIATPTASGNDDYSIVLT
ncbi:MAG: hypothetical protein EBT12_14510 [Marivivens sp.]|nr:hypothetical protein [Marivivens sp.]